MKGPAFETWRWRSDLVSWSYTVPPLDGESMIQCLERAVTESIRNLTPFARLRSLAISTLEQGDDTYQFDGPSVDYEKLHEAVVDPAHVHVVSLDLDLAVVLEPHGTDIWLDSAASMFIELDERSEIDQSIKMSISLDVDIYSPITWGIRRDNAELSRRNGPRLSYFLRTLRQKLAASLDSMDVGDYRDHVDENGFH